MMRVRVRASALGALGLCLLGTGCVAAVRRPASAPAVTLASRTAVRLEPATAGGVPCSVQRAELQVTAVRGDSLFFRAATPLKWPNAAPRCTLDGAGWVDVAAHPDLELERLERGGTRGFLSVAYATFAVIGTMLLAAVVSFG